MPDITKGTTFTSGQTVTAALMNTLVDDATINDNAIDADKLAANAVTNAKVSSSAAIAHSKLAALTSGNVLVGNGDNVATSVALSSELAAAVFALADGVTATTQDEDNDSTTVATTAFVERDATTHAALKPSSTVYGHPKIYVTGTTLYIVTT